MNYPGLIILLPLLFVLIGFVFADEYTPFAVHEAVGVTMLFTSSLFYLWIMFSIEKENDEEKEKYLNKESSREK